MKLLRTLLLTAIFIATAGQAVATPLTEQADSAYATDNYRLAAELYSRAAAEEGVSATLYYNLGNAWYRLDRPGLAILNYQRALRIDPTFTDARENMKFVNSRITDRPGERGTFVGNTLDAVADTACSNTWAWLAFGVFALACGFVALYVFNHQVRLRKIGFFSALALLLVTGICIFFSTRAASRATDRSMAVVTVPSSILSTTPRQPLTRAEEAMLLHEGTMVRILDSVKAVNDTTGALWLDVEVDNTHRAWINSKDVERVR